MPIKQMFEYTDIDGIPTTKTVMFNLTQFEVEGEMELEVIQARFQRFQDEVIGDDVNAPLREMTGPEKREILGMVKTLIKHSYGIREGKRFIKNQEVWDEFEQTGAFSAFLYWLFSSPGRVNTFMEGIWPQGVDRPEDEPRPDLKVVQDATDVPADGKGGVKVIEDTTPQIESETRQFQDKITDYSSDYFLKCSDAEFQALFDHFTEGKNVPFQLLVAGQVRQARARGEETGGQTDE